VFLKWFDHESGTLSFLGHAIVNGAWRIGQLVPSVLAARGLAPDTPLAAFEEIKPTMINPLDLDAEFTGAEMQVGDIITWQVDPAHHNPDTAKFETAKDFYM
jgi:ubiquitin carboxyl-terminal hydrolase 7